MAKKEDQALNPYHPPRSGNTYRPEDTADRGGWRGLLAAGIAMSSLGVIFFLYITTWDKPWVSPIEDAVMAILPRWQAPRFCTGGILAITGAAASIYGLVVGNKTERLLCLGSFVLLGPPVIWYLGIVIFGPLFVFLQRSV